MYIRGQYVHLPRYVPGLWNRPWYVQVQVPSVVTLRHDWTLGLLDPFVLVLRSIVLALKSFAISLVFATIII